jgi:hypothetical protein
MRNRKQKKGKTLPPRLGRFGPSHSPPPLLRGASPSPSAAQAAQQRPRSRLTTQPHPAATPPLSLSRRSPAGSPGPLVRSLVPPMPSPARSPPTTARPVSSPLTRAPASATSPLTVPEPSPHPPACPSHPVVVCAITAIMASSSALSSLLPSPPPRTPIKGTARALPSPHQPRLLPPLLPEPD